MAQYQTHAFHTIHNRAIFPGTPSLFVGSFDDNMFCHGPQLVKPIDTSFITRHMSTVSKASSLSASPLSDSDYDSAVIADEDDEYSEDELPPSPKRRHSGAMSISEEDLPLCYDREALRRETNAHRERQHHHHHHHHQHHHHQAAERSSDPEPLKQRGRAGTFAAHEQWDVEIDGPSMALWVPEKTSTECKRRRTEGMTSLSSSSPSFHRMEVPPQHHVSHIEGPMMCLWEV